MNKPLSTDQLKESLVILDQVLGRVQVMDRAVKLRRWAKLCREYGFPLALYHGLEYWYRSQLDIEIHQLPGVSAMTLAANDPEFHTLGLPRPDQCTVSDIMEFFSFSQQQLHEFSCDCGGHISNDEQARRIERLV